MRPSTHQFIETKRTEKAVKAGIHQADLTYCDANNHDIDRHGVSGPPLWDTALINEGDMDQFHQDGVVVLRGVLEPDIIEGLKEDVARQMRHMGDSHSAYDFESLQKTAWSEQDYKLGAADRFNIEAIKSIIEADPKARPVRDLVDDGDKGLFFYDAAQWRHYEAIRHLALDSDMPEICAALLETDYLNFWEDNTFVKAPQTAQRTVFHQDWAYFQISGEKCCIVWVPLDVVTRDNGAMEYIRGSHRWGRKFAPNLLFAQSPNPLSPYERVPDIEANRDDFDIVSFDVEPGDVIIHHVLTVHGAGGNRTRDQYRRAVTLRYCGDDVRYYNKPGAAEPPALSTRLVDGSPLYDKAYPRVWPRPFPKAQISRLYT